jgi:hypothetical protein
MLIEFESLLLCIMNALVQEPVFPSVCAYTISESIYAMD